MNLSRRFDFSRVPRPPVTPDRRSWRGFADLGLEIGAGSGQFAESYCAAYPERGLISLERTLLRSRHLLGRARPNLFAYRADAVNFVSHFVGEESLSRIFILYPNPYPKAKQANLRWHNMPFMDCLLGKLRGGGELVLATNIESYFLEACSRFAERADLGLVSAEAYTGAPRTLFEHKYLKRGERCWQLVARKV